MQNLAPARVSNFDETVATGRVLGRSVSYPRHLTILDLFERLAASNPTRIAARYGLSSLTYQELDRRAAALAVRLAEMGVSKGTIVPVAISNSLELPLAWLAVLKLAAVFVPLDPEWPQDRLIALVQMIAPRVVLVDSQVVPYSVAQLQVDGPSLLNQEQELFAVRPSPDDLAYGFFTSGSTGIPKCALNTHRGLMNRFCFMTRRFVRHGHKVTLQNSRHVFDSSLWQLLWPLTEGGEVIIPERAGRLDLSRTIELIERYGVTMTDFVPSIFGRLVHLLEADRSLVARIGSLREVLLGGEPINAIMVARFRQMLPHVGITNTYGPTEAAIGMVFHQVSAEDGDEIPLGTPIDNTFLVVLDEDRQAVAPGVVGEICIGGDCLGVGYLNDPTKTDAAFVPNTFPTIPGSRIYRTGDLGYWRGDDLVYFAGRIDDQAKVAGVRVELREIDHALLKHPAVKEAAAIAVTEPNGSKTLVAMVVNNDPLSEEELQAHLRALLPKEILPRQILRLEDLPLTANGKLDRRALEMMFRARTDISCSEAGLAETLDDDVLRLFRTTLRRPSLGLDDDFFRCGGDSLMALDLLLELEEFGRARLEIGDIYAAPTARALARRLAEGSSCTPCQVDWDAEVRRHMIPTSYKPHVGGSGAVLLTGGTGFVGAHIMADLLQDPSRRVYCAVRAANPDDGLARIKASLEGYQLYQPHFQSRIQPLISDLSEPWLGLPRSRWTALAEEIDAIVHAGAMVDFLHNYDRHSPTNVVGTAQILAFAASGRPKQLHHISTLGICRCPPTHRFPIREEQPLPASTISEGGYGQSKWVAEQLVRDAQARGLKVVIHRLGEIGPSTVTGAPNARSFLHILLRSCAALHAYPVGKLTFDWTPANAVAAYIVSALDRPDAAGKTFHVFDSNFYDFQDLCGSLSRHGVEMHAVLDAEFLQMLEHGAAAGRRELRQLWTLTSQIENGHFPLANFVCDASQSFSNRSYLSFLSSNHLRLPSAAEIPVSCLGRALIHVG